MCTVATLHGFKRITASRSCNFWSENYRCLICFSNFHFFDCWQMLTQFVIKRREDFIGFAFLHPLIGQENWRRPLDHPFKSRATTNRVVATLVFPRLVIELFILPANSTCNWLLVMLIFVLIGYCNCLSYGFDEHMREALKYCP